MDARRIRWENGRWNADNAPLKVLWNGRSTATH